MNLSVSAEFHGIHPEDLFIYNKLQLSCLLEYNCGPAGAEVPSPGHYIIRPAINFLGMGRYSRIDYLEKSTEHLHPGEFWCEIFTGDHLSIDYQNKIPALSVLGHRDPQSPLYKWSKWEKTDKTIEFPKILNNLKGNYEWINCEFIGNNLIEVHCRQNPDFRYGNNTAIPSWGDENLEINQGYKFVRDPDYLREGFWIK
jgi:hypothetical protein